MPNSHHQKSSGDLYPVDVETLQKFLMQQGFVGPMELNSDSVVLNTPDKSLYVKLPHTKTINKLQVEQLLEPTEIIVAEFDSYLEHLNAMRTFNMIVDQSLKKK